MNKLSYAVKMFVLIWATLVLTVTGSENNNTTSTPNNNNSSKIKKNLNNSAPDTDERCLFSSTCKNQSYVLTSECLCKGCPVPARLPLANIFEFAGLTSVKNFSVSVSIDVSLKDVRNIKVSCTSKNDINETKVKIIISYDPEITTYQKFINILNNIFGDQLLYLVIFGIGILIGSLVTTCIACLAIKCCRKKKSSSIEKLELVTTENVPKGYDDEIQSAQQDGTPDLQDDGIQIQVVAGCGEDPAGDLIDSDVSPKETVYSDIDFSALKEKSPENARVKAETPETEYAEIKRGDMEEEQQNEGTEGEMMVENDETEVMIEDQEEPQGGILVEEVIAEDVPLYSNPKEVMDEN